MRTPSLFLLSFTLSILPSLAHAEPPINNNCNDRLTIELCILTSERPHISKHVPGTVNVTGRTVCKGISSERNLRVTVTLSRLDGGNTPAITKSSTGVGNVVVNVAMACIWQRGDALVQYRIKTTHKISNGKTGTTMNTAELAC